MVFEGDSLKGYRIDVKNDKVVRIDLPNVAERKQGKWIEKDSYFEDIIYQCSCCNGEFYSLVNEPLYKYCPNCGCRMTKED